MSEPRGQKTVPESKPPVLHPESVSDQPRLGWPWCGDVPTGGERRGDVIATRHPDDQITLTWQDGANCTIVGRAVLDGIVAERNRLTRENREHEQRAELLRSQAAELEQERDEAIEHDRQPYPTADAYEAACRALDRHRADAAQRGAELDAARAALLEQLRVNEVLNVQRGEARAEVERLRGLLAEALDGWEAAFSTHTPDPTGRIAEIRREAGQP